MTTTARFPTVVRADWVSGPPQGQWTYRDYAAIYERAQVPEYWIVNPGEKVVEMFTLENGTYRSLGAFQGDDILPAQIVPEWTVPVKRFFASK
jgi:Uma2 family endonuclease